MQSFIHAYEFFFSLYILLTSQNKEDQGIKEDNKEEANNSVWSQLGALLSCELLPCGGAFLEKDDHTVKSEQTTLTVKSEQTTLTQFLDRTNDLINQADDLTENQAESLPSVEGQKSPQSAPLKSLEKNHKVSLSPRSKSKKTFAEEPASTAAPAAESWSTKEGDANGLAINEDEAVSIIIYII